LKGGGPTGGKQDRRFNADLQISEFLDSIIEATHSDVKFTESKKNNYVRQSHVMKNAKTDDLLTAVNIDKPLLHISFKKLLALKKKITTNSSSIYSTCTCFAALRL